jgi:predicted short-subunit dehydrogenase-like oxidoreductase (DUF2520 family)
MSLKLCFIGAGNLATHLSNAFLEKGFKISQVYSKTELSAKALADNLNTQYTTSAKEIKSADIYIVALKDSAVHEVLSKIDFKNKLVVHCSGSLPLSVLKQYSKNIGVFYPLQTFSKSRNVDFKTIPIFIESNSKENEQQLFDLASEISNSVSVLNSEKRQLLHISAVFACNFVNHFYTLSAEILNSKGISFDVLKPLILETAQKVQEMDPVNAQTGPAVRFDENIISAHLEALNSSNDNSKLYNSISKSIFEHHKKLD